MKLSKLKLMSYRCFGSEEQVIPIGKLTTFMTEVNVSVK